MLRQNLQWYPKWGGKVNEKHLISHMGNGVILNNSLGWHNMTVLVEFMAVWGTP